jgi:hypothetical protein
MIFNTDWTCNYQLLSFLQAFFLSLTLCLILILRGWFLIHLDPRHFPVLAGLSALMVLLAAVIYSRRCVLVSSLPMHLISQCLLPLSSTSYFHDQCLFFFSLFYPFSESLIPPFAFPMLRGHLFFLSEFHDMSSESNLVRDDDSDLGYGEGGKGGWGVEAHKLEETLSCWEDGFL